MLFAVTVSAKFATPDRIKLLDERSKNGRRIRQNAILKVATFDTLGAHTRTREIGATEVSGFTVNNDTFEITTVRLKLGQSPDQPCKHWLTSML